MANLIAVRPPDLPDQMCPEEGCKGVVLLDTDPVDDCSHYLYCATCFAEWEIDGTPIVRRYDCTDCGAKGVAPGAHTCAPYLKSRQPWPWSKRESQ